MKPSIPKPCIENYEHMPPSELGKFCIKCNTEVVDFTNWKPEDIIQYIQNSKTKVCGKLSQKTTNTKCSKYSWSILAKLAASVLLLHNWNDLKADIVPLKVTNAISIHKTQSTQDSVILQFIDHENRPLPYVNLINSITKQRFIADSIGQIKISTLQEVNFKALLIGYETKNIKIDKADSEKTIKVTLDYIQAEIGEVVIKSSLPFSLRLKNWLNILSIRDKE